MPGIERKDAGRGPNKIRGNAHHTDEEFWRYEANIVYDFGRTRMNEKLNIFVSSVQKKLEDERVIVQNLLSTDPFLSAHFSPILSEFGSVSPDKALFALQPHENHGSRTRKKSCGILVTGVANW